MLKKNERTLDEYKKAGARMRLYKTLASKLYVAISHVVSAKDQDKLDRAIRRIDEVCSNAEDNMFRDFPDLGNEYIDVFYGATNSALRNSVDEEIIALAKEAVNELFERKND